MNNEVRFDFDRAQRIGVSEAILCEGKSIPQIEYVLLLASRRKQPVLLTRLSPETLARIDDRYLARIDFDPISRTGIFGPWQPPEGPAAVVVVSAGSSDVPVAREAVRTLAFHGRPAEELNDVGVAGLWRLMEHQERLRSFSVIIVVAGMDGALFSVVGGLVGGAVIAVPTDTGYGAARNGRTALDSALASCAPGVVVVNVGNGFGAACAALRVLGAVSRT